jgi:hypothetical protein
MIAAGSTASRGRFDFTLNGASQLAAIDEKFAAMNSILVTSWTAQSRGATAECSNTIRKALMGGSA